jgi:hypothetical protein
MTPEEAQRDALIKFGCTDAVKEDYGKQLGIPAVETMASSVLSTMSASVPCQTSAFSPIVRRPLVWP